MDELKDLGVIYEAMGKRVKDVIYSTNKKEAEWAALQKVWDGNREGLEEKVEGLEEKVRRFSAQVTTLQNMLKESERKRAYLAEEVSALTTVRDYIKKFKGGKK
jgi:predicted RNase H-like nuclease (RuvC/YqgF family)